jgi:hydrogenase expression/formation protein HypC
MCLAIPGKIIKIDENIATVEIGNIQRETNIILLPDAKINDYVLLHAGFAIQKIDEEEAFKTFELLEQMEQMYEEEYDQNDVLKKDKK